MLAPKQKSLEILTQLGVFGRKTASEFMLHRWKLHAKSLASDDPIESNRLLAIIAVYENDYKNAENYFKKALVLSNYKNDLVLSDYAQSMMMQGKGIDAINIFTKAFFLNPSFLILDRILSISVSTLYSDVLPELKNVINKLDKNYEYTEWIEKYENKISNNREILDSLEISIKTYRSVISLNDSILFKKFYTQTQLAYYQIDNMLNVIVYPEGLSVDDISELNDDFVENVVELDNPYDELMRLSVYFSFQAPIKEEVA